MMSNYCVRCDTTYEGVWQEHNCEEKDGLQIAQDEMMKAAKEFNMREDRSTLIYFVQTLLNTFKRAEEQGYHTKDREYAITLLEKAMEHKNDIWNEAINAAANKIESTGFMLLAYEIRSLKK